MRLFSFAKLSLVLLTQGTALRFATICKQHFERALGNIGAWSCHVVGFQCSWPRAQRASGPFRREAG